MRVIPSKKPAVRMLAFLLLLTSVLAVLSGCAKKADPDAITTPAQSSEPAGMVSEDDDNELVLVPQYVTLPEELKDYAHCFMSEGRLYFIWNPFEFDSEGHALPPQLWSMLPDGTELTQIKGFHTGKPTDYEYILYTNGHVERAADAGGFQAWLFTSDYLPFYDPEVDDYVDNYCHQFSLINLDSGEPVKSLPVNTQTDEIVIAIAANDLGQLLYAAIRSGTIYITIIDTETNVIVYDREIEPYDASWIYNAFALSDGRFALTASRNSFTLPIGDSGQKLIIPNIEMQYYEVYDLELQSNTLQCAMLPETDNAGHPVIIANGKSGIVCIPLSGDEDAEPVEIANYASCDIPPQCDIVGRADGNLVLVDHKRSTQTTEIITLIPTRKKDVPKVVNLKIAAYYDPGLSPSILEFNKTNPDSHVELVLFDSYSGLKDAMVRMTADGGTYAEFDMIVTDYLPYDIYTSKGLLEDLAPFLERDNIKLLDGVLNSISDKGKIFNIGNSFIVNTLAANGKALGINGSSKGWTFSEMQSTLSKNPGTYIFPARMAREDVLYELLEANIDFYADRTTGQVIFDSPDFIELLEYIKTFKARDPNDYYASYIRDMERILTAVEGKSVGEYRFVNIIEQFMIFEAIYADAVYIGLPAGSRNGNSIELNQSIAIMSQSKKKEAAWLFIKHLLDESYSKISEVVVGSRPGFPVVESEFDKMLNTYMKEPRNWYDIQQREYTSNYIIDGSFKFTESDFTRGEYPYMRISFEDSNVIIDIPPLTEAQAEKFKALINSINRTSSSDTTILNIVQEEISWFFADQRTAAETARTIQSRVSIFIAEQS